MRLATFLLTSSAAAGAYAAARRLIDDETVIERLPEAAQAPAARLRTKLLHARAVVADGLREGRAEREAAQQELMQEYHRLAQR